MDGYRIDWRKLGNRVAEMRIERGLTQMELAEMTGLSVTYIGYLEQGKRHGKLETYLQLVTVMGYSMNDLTAAQLSNNLTECLVWEITRALSGCGADKKDLIVQIVRDMVRVIHIFRAD